MRPLSTSAIQRIQSAEAIAQAEGDLREIRKKLGDGFSEEEFLEAALRRCFPEATDVTVARLGGARQDSNS